MSDSEAEIPSEAAISRALRDVVVSIHKSGKNEDLTVKRVRIRAEDKLGLPSGFFQREDWKQKSKEQILESVDKYCNDEPAPTPPKPKASSKTAKPKSEPKKPAKSATDGKRGVKRKATAPPKKAQQKRRKTALSDEESELSDVKAEDEPSDADSEPPKKPARRQKKVVAAESDDDEDEPPLARAHDTVEADSDGEEVPAVQDISRKKTPPSDTKDGASDSEMSILIDESPAKKRQKKVPIEKGSKGKPKATKAKAAPKSKTEDDPDQAEIKRLQGWLVKCGIRKVWGKELANCDTSKEKIRHLKGMLKDAGMDGKYSNEKAAQIKEKREFAKDLEETQAGALAWGASEEADAGRPRRRAAAKPIPKPVVLSDDEDEDEGDAEEEKDAADDDMDDDDDESVKGDSEDDGDDDVDDSGSD